MSEPCRCNCGYMCGGPGVCKLSLMGCLAAGHFVKDCDHDFGGDLVDMGGGGQSVVCQKCGMSALAHDCRCGP